MRITLGAKVNLQNAVLCSFLIVKLGMFFIQNCNKSVFFKQPQAVVWSEGTNRIREVLLTWSSLPWRVCVLQSAPPPISARGRSDDLSTILSVIADAKEFIHISVMDYLPLSQYTEPVRWPDTLNSHRHTYSRHGHLKAPDYWTLSIKYRLLCSGEKCHTWYLSQFLTLAGWQQQLL